MHYQPLLIVSLALLSIATLDSQRGSAVRVPFNKRPSLTHTDGTFNLKKANAQTAVTKNKYRQNLINLERNLGRDAFNEGAEILPLATIQRRHQSEPLIDEPSNSEWVGSIFIGSPRQNFVVDFDTGSSDLWVVSSSCTSQICSSRNKYNSLESFTSARKSGSFSITYTDGSTVSGPIYSDNVSVAAVEAEGLLFSPVAQLSSVFEGNPIDGVLGLGYPALSNMNATPFINTAFLQGTISQNVFGLKLSTDGSELCIGGVDDSLFHDNLEYYNVQTSSGFWQIIGAKVLVGQNTIVSGFQTIFDSGTTITYGPPSAVAQVYAQVPGSALHDAENGYYSFPCSQVPSIAFNWGGENWAFTAENFNLGQVAPNSNRCVGALSAQNLGLGTNVWVLGDSFIKNVYTAFSFDRNAVGIAPLAT